jgi:hypothetical protein
MDDRTRQLVSLIRIGNARNIRLLFVLKTLKIPVAKQQI